MLKNIAEEVVIKASYKNYVTILNRLETDPTFKIPWTMSQIEESLSFFEDVLNRSNDNYK